MKILEEFRQFALRGNVVDMAVGIIIGGAFGKIVTSLVDDIIMPPIGVIIGGVDFTELALTLKPAVSSSGESHHREFPTLENRHGTFMYLNKDQFILDKLKVLEGVGLTSARLDLRQISDMPRSAEGIGQLVAAYESDTVDSKVHWPRPAFAPFFRRNKTTKQFSKLKPQTHMVRDERCLARVLMGRKPYQMILWALQDFTAEGDYVLVLPDGTEIACPDLRFRNMRGLPLEDCKEDQLLITNWVKKCCPGALLLRV